MTARNKLVLVGLPCTGKSTVAPLVAERLGWPCVDLDAQIEQGAGRSAQAIFGEDGEAAFRARELHALDAVLRSDGAAVVAAGGGLITQQPARRRLLDEALVVCLDAPDEVLLRRLNGGGARPLLGREPGPTLAGLRRKRAAAYSTAHARVDATEDPAQVAERIAGMARDSALVATPTGSYPVLVRPGAAADLAEHVPVSATSVALVSDRAVAGQARAVHRHLRAAGFRVRRMQLKGGEPVKTWRSAGRLLTRLSDAGIRRGDCIVVMGGGTVGDLAGFVAATYMRGIAWINVPTTLLAMVDSAVGGKTGVNLPRGKNLAGAFWQPRAVIADPLLLRAQPQRSFRAAFSEVVKYAMISGGAIGEMLESRLDPLLQREADALTAVIAESCRIKARIVSEDEREHDVRAVLNYGHTVAHAIEAARGFSDALNHGEAVAAGMRIAGRLSMRVVGCPDADIEWQDEMLRRCGISEIAPVRRGTVIERLERDKKVSGGRVGWVLLRRRGEPCTGQDVPDDVRDEVLTEMLPQ